MPENGRSLSGASLKLKSSLPRNKRVIYQFWSKRAPSGDCSVTFMEAVEPIRMHISGDPGIFPSYTLTFTDVAVSDVSARYP